MKGTLVIAVLVCALMLPTASSASSSAEAGKITVAAASDLQYAFTEVGKAFTRKTGIEVVFTFGSSGQFSQQIVNGAPYDLFASADDLNINRVLNAGAGDPTTRKLYAYGRIVIWQRKGSNFRIRKLADLRNSAIRTIAIAEPRTAPYGQAAVAALQTARVYGDVESKFVYGTNIAATQQLVSTGNADVGVIALSLALAPQFAGASWSLIPTSLYPRLAQTLVVTTKNSAQAGLAKQFIAFEQSKPAQTIMRKYGFLLPGQKPPVIRVNPGA